jgi:hypothetical protein
MALIAEVIGHLDRQTGLQDPGHQRRQQPAVAGQRDPLRAGLVDQAARHDRQIITHRPGPLGSSRASVWAITGTVLAEWPPFGCPCRGTVYAGDATFATGERGHHRGT